MRGRIKKMLIGGVDDAGRGSVIGPMSIAGVIFNSSILPKLISLGVKDSKLLSPKKREFLREKILNLSNNHHIVLTPPVDIDFVVENGKKLNRLNRLEAKIMAEVIKKLKPEKVYVDASDVLAKRFGQHILEDIPFKVKIVSKHNADKIYPIVSAASIIAKVERDRVIADLRKKHGDFGSGYPSDKKTIKFLENWLRTYEDFPDFVRKSWKTAKRLKTKKKKTNYKLVL
jgi:ribonuclease HII